MLKKSLVIIVFAGLAIITLMFIGAVFSERSDAAGKQTLRTDGENQVSRTIAAFNVGVNKKDDPNLPDEPYSCLVTPADAVFGSDYLKCSINRNIESEPTANPKKDVSDYRKFYDDLLADGWSNQIKIHKDYGADRDKTMLVKSGSQLPMDGNGDLQIHTSKQLKNGVRCLLSSNYIAPRISNTGNIMSVGSISLTVICDFKGSSESVFNHPNPD